MAEGPNYSREQILQGNRLQQEGKNELETFPKSGGAVGDQPVGDMSKTKGTRMAGDMGGFAMALLTNPTMQANVGQWMQQFNQSNPGMEFNRAKMMMAGNLPPPDEMGAAQ